MLLGLTRITICYFSFLLTIPICAQLPEMATVKDIQTLIEQDSLSKAKIEAAKNIAYYQKEKNFDSLVNYIQFEGSSKLNNGNKALAVTKAEALTTLIKKSDNPNAIQEALKELSWVYDNSGQLQKAYDNLDEAIVFAKKIKDPTSTALAAINYKKGYYASNMGDYPSANSHYKEALRLLIKSKQDDYVFYNQVYNALGGMMWQEAKLDSAKYYFEQAVLVLEKTDEKDIMNRYYRPALIKMNLAVISNAIGKNREAIQFSNEAILGYQNYIENSVDEARIFKAKGNLLITIDNLSVFYNTLGEYARSQELMEYSYEQKKKLYEKMDIQIAISLIILSEAKTINRDFDGAMIDVDKALSILNNDTGTDLYWHAAALSAKGSIYEKTNDIKNAEIYFGRGLDMYRKSLSGIYQKDVLDIMIEISLFYAKNKQREKALALAVETYNTTHNGEFKNTLQEFYHTINLAQVHYLLKDYSEAKKYSDEALRFKIIDSSGKTAATDSILGQYRKPQALLINAASKYYLNEKRDIQFLKGLLVQLEEGISILDQRKKVVNNNEDVSLLITENDELLDFSKKLRLELFQLTKDEKYLNKLVALHESSIYNRIRSRLNLRGKVAFKNVPKRIIEREEKLKTDLTSTLNDTDNSIQPYIEATAAWDQFLDTLNKKYPDYFKMRYATLEEPIEGLQKKIPANTTIVRYLFIEDELYAYVVSSNNKNIQKLEYKGVKNHIDKLAKNDFAVENSRKLLFELYQALWAPIESYVDTKKVIIVPDRELFNLSFETLTPKPLKDFKEFATNSLLAKYDISYNFSLLIYKDKGKVEDYSSKFIAFAPGFNDKMKSEYKLGVSDSLQMDKSYLTLLPQPLSEDLAKKYAKIFEGNFFVNENASKSLFINEAKEHKIIHIGTHAESNNISPELSRLIFAKSNNQKDYHDNSLYTYEIYNINLSSNLAILTACETGKPTYQAGEGMISLAHAFQYAGSESILTSLWKIDEESSTKIINLFYENLEENLPKDEALRKAKLDYLSTAVGRTAAPQYWAGLVLIGDTSPIDLKTFEYWWWIAGGIVVLIIAFLLFRFFLSRKERHFI